MNTFSSQPITDAVFDLAEGVIWDDREQLVRWVDIREGRVLAGKLGVDRLNIVQDIHFGETVGAVALAEDGGLLVAGAHGLATVAMDGSISRGPDLEPHVARDGRSPWRLNDGIVDPQGRYVVGTLSLDDAATDGPREVLLLVSPNGNVETLRTNVGMSNGLGFSPDGSTIFHIDTIAGTLSRHSYGEVFDTSEPWVVVIDDFPHFADGMTIDANGDIWVAFWGGSTVARYSPDGTRVASVTINAKQPTCVGFVGESLNRLAITSARKGLSSISDESGALFLANVETSGKPEYRWQGSTTQPSWINSDGEN